jgi:hypothetical protein
VNSKDNRSGYNAVQKMLDILGYYVPAAKFLVLDLESPTSATSVLSLCDIVGFLCGRNEFFSLLKYYTRSSWNKMPSNVMVFFTAWRLSSKFISSRLSVNKTTQGLTQHHPRRKEENNSLSVWMLNGFYWFRFCREQKSLVLLLTSCLQTLLKLRRSLCDKRSRKKLTFCISPNLRLHC